MENINNIIHTAFLNSSKDLKINKEQTLKSATLDAAWKKHGTKSNSSSHLVFEGDGKEKDIRADFETMLFVEGTDPKTLGAKGKWHMSFMSASKNLLIARVGLESFWTNFNAMLGATQIENVPEDTVCTVKELGFHPTLVCKGEFFYTNEITAIIELDGSKDSDLGDACSRLKGEPILVTWFPGRQLPVSEPHDCAVGDKLTAAEAKAKGWNTVSFTD